MDKAGTGGAQMAAGLLVDILVSSARYLSISSPAVKTALQAIRRLATLIYCVIILGSVIFVVITPTGNVSFSGVFGPGNVLV